MSFTTAASVRSVISIGDRQYEFVPRDQKSQTTLARSCTKDARKQNTQSCHEMDPIWKEEKRQAKDHLVEDSDERAGRDGSYVGRSTSQSSEQVGMAKFCCGFMSQAGRRG